VTNGNSVRFCFDNDAKSAALAARNPRHGNAPEISNECFTLAVKELRLASCCMAANRH
jgi:hypothetical protein